MTRLSPLHSKGILMLSLVALTETVTFANAVSFWTPVSAARTGAGSHNNPRHAAATAAASSNNNNNNGSQPSKTTCSALDGSCPSDFAAAASVEDCCKSCSDCMDASVVSRQCAQFPRGGHSATLEAAAAAASTAPITTPYGLPLNVWKVLLQAMLTAINVFCWLVPLKSKKITENKLGLSLANAFSGGVFLSLAFGHLIPECLHGFEGYAETTPFLLVLGGYLLIFFVEKVAFDAHDILHEMQGGDGCSGHDHNNKKSGSNRAVEKAAPVTGRSAIILLGALAVHSILEMMALGLADNFGECALLTLSISLHQPAESIALLVAFLKSGLSEGDIIKYLSIFSCMGPIGVGLGMAVNEYAAPIIDSMMLAVVAGTFVYVGATEVIPEEWEDSTHKWKKFAALMSGIVSIYGITQYTMSLGGHSH